MAVFRSLVHISVQVIDDVAGRTLVSASSVEPSVKATFEAGTRGCNKAGAQVVGRTVSERLLSKGIKTVVFDRGGWSEKVFRTILDEGFDLLTYRKAPLADWPDSWFHTRRLQIEGHAVEYELADGDFIRKGWPRLPRARERTRPRRWYTQTRS